MEKILIELKKRKEWAENGLLIYGQDGQARREYEARIEEIENAIYLVTQGTQSKGMIPSERLKIITKPNLQQSELIARANFAVQSVFLQGKGTETLLVKNIKNGSETLLIRIEKEGYICQYRYDNPEPDTISKSIKEDLIEYEKP